MDCVPSLRWFFGSKAFWNWIDLKGKALTNRKYPYKRPQRALSSLLPCEEDAYDLGNWLSTEIKAASTLIFDFPASRTVRNLLFLSHPVYAIIAAQNDNDSQKIMHMYTVERENKCGQMANLVESHTGKFLVLVEHFHKKLFKIKMFQS